eukprot:8063972-Pyramimonas_sp.AAC.1
MTESRFQNLARNFALAFAVAAARGPTGTSRPCPRPTPASPPSPSRHSPPPFTASPSSLRRRPQRAAALSKAPLR